MDIINRLREFSLDGATYADLHGLMFEAANEIERLRALVNEQSHGETYGRRSGGAKERLF